MRVTRVVLCLTPVALALAGCASLTPSRSGTAIEAEQPAPPPPPPPPPEPTEAMLDMNPTGGGAPAQPVQPVRSLVLLTPLTQITRAPSASYAIPGDSYTRLTITSLNGGTGANAAKNPEIYPYATRSPIARFFVGTRHSVTLTAKVSSGQFIATVPLLTVTHDSTRSGGEAFTRIVRHQASDFPLFLVRKNATSDVASVTFELKGNDQVDSSIAGTALSAVLQATKLLAAPPALLTSLTADSGKTVASAIDAAIGQLFSMSLSEQQVLDSSIRDWQPITLILSLPRRQGHWNDRVKPPAVRGQTRLDELDLVPVGRWTVAFERPRVSAFSSVVLCAPTPGDSCPAGAVPTVEAARAAALNDIKGRPEDILTFRLIADSGEVGTLASYLRQLDWWTKTLDDLKDATSDADPLCRDIRNAVSTLGFNAFDSQRIIEAVAGSALVTKAQAKAITTARASGDPNACKDSLPAG